MTAEEHWLVVGASSAMARAFVRELASRGVGFTLAGRDTEDLAATAADARVRGASFARVVACDISVPQDRAALVQALDGKDGRLCILLAAGAMPSQEELGEDPSLLAAMIASNYAGPAALLEALVERFSSQRGGTVVIIGSVAGDRGRLKNYQYGSTKAALSVYAEGLRARLFRCGAHVCLVRPGFVDTAMTWGLPGLFLVASPAQCAKAIVRGVDRHAENVYVPRFWRYVMLIIRHIPAAFMKRLNI